MQNKNGSAYPIKEYSQLDLIRKLKGRVLCSEKGTSLGLFCISDAQALNEKLTNC